MVGSDTLSNTIKSETMEFVSAVVEAIKTQRGKINDSFFAILSDYRAFDDEEFYVKGIVKQICDSGFVIQLSKLSSSDNLWKTKVTDMIYKMTVQYGYQQDIVSEIFHKLAIGFRIVDYSFDWKKEFSSGTNNSRNQSNSQGGQKNSQPSNPLTGGTVKNNCPNCGTQYYKPYSKFCHVCGSQR